MLGTVVSALQVILLSELLPRPRKVGTVVVVFAEEEAMIHSSY